MFDPFHDFNTAGYLRNVRRDKAEETIKHFEHNQAKFLRIGEVDIRGQAGGPHFDRAARFLWFGHGI